VLQTEEQELWRIAAVNAFPRVPALMNLAAQHNRSALSYRSLFQQQCIALRNVYTRQLELHPRSTLSDYQLVVEAQYASASYPSTRVERWLGSIENAISHMPLLHLRHVDEQAGFAHVRVFCVHESSGATLTLFDTDVSFFQRSSRPLPVNRLLTTRLQMDPTFYSEHFRLAVECREHILRSVRLSFKAQHEETAVRMTRKSMLAYLDLFAPWDRAHESLQRAKMQALYEPSMDAPALPRPLISALARFALTIEFYDSTQPWTWTGNLRCRKAVLSHTPTFEASLHFGSFEPSFDGEALMAMSDACLMVMKHQLWGNAEEMPALFKQDDGDEPKHRLRILLSRPDGRTLQLLDCAPSDSDGGPLEFEYPTVDLPQHELLTARLVHSPYKLFEERFALCAAVYKSGCIEVEFVLAHEGVSTMTVAQWLIYAEHMAPWPQD
jgi:hypothetical protein